MQDPYPRGGWQPTIKVWYTPLDNYNSFVSLLYG
jgi:hypothetical protein